MSVDDYFNKIERVINNAQFRKGVEVAINNYRINKKRYIDDYVRDLAKEVRKIKEFSISKLNDLVKIAIDSFVENGCDVYMADSSKDAIEIIKDVVKPGEIIVKGKSMTTEEIMLREYLSEYGIEIWETDLGELLIQLSGDTPAHPVIPALHMTKEYIADLLKVKLRADVSTEPENITNFVRNFLRKKFINASIGMSSGNVVSAKDGAILILENEGNVRLSTSLPRKYIAIIGIEKIVPSMQDAFKVIEVIWRYAGYKIANYVNVIAGPSKTADIENTLVKGVHGPRDVYIIFLDNGRSSMLKNHIFKEALYCIRCGACMYECPVFKVIGGRFGYKYVGGIGAVWCYHTINKELGLSMAYTCLRDGRCVEACPLKIDVPKMILELRSIKN